MPGSLSFYINIIGATFLLLCCNLLPSSAQSLEWSQPHKVEDRALFTSILGQNDDGLFIMKQNYRQRKRNILLEQYGANMRKLNSKVFLSRKDEFLLKVAMQPHEIQLFYGTYNRDTKTNEFKVKRLNFSLNSIGTDSLLFTLPEREFEEDLLQVHKLRQVPYSIIIYPKQNILVPTSYQYMLLDSALALTSTGQLYMELENKYEIEQAAYTKDEIVLLIKEDVKRKTNRQGYNYIIFSGNIRDVNLKKTQLFDDSVNVTEGILKTDYINNKFVFAGLFNLRDSSYSKGYYIWQKNFSATDVSAIAQPFSNAIISEIAGRNFKLQGLYNLQLGNLILRQDGGFIITTEEYKVNREIITDMSMYGGSQSNFRYYYYYNNVIVLSVNKEGLTDWHKVLRKEQVSINDNGIYSSYLMAVMPDKLLFVYNDLSRKNWNLSTFDLNAQGSSRSGILLKSNEYDARLIPRDGQQVSADQFVIPGFSRKGQVLLRINL